MPGSAPDAPRSPVTVFEGPDGAGKSTLLWGHLERLGGGVPVAHGPYPGEEAIWLRYLASLLRDRRPTDLDRAWPSEPVYGRAVREGEVRLAAWQRRMLERVALARRGVVVLCLPRWRVVKESYLARKGEEYVDRLDGIAAVYEGYAALAQRRPALPLKLYDREVDDPATFLEAVERSRPRANRGPGIGRWRPGEVTLLVGDQAHPTGLPAEADGLDLPFVSAAGCSPWLAERLEEAGVGEGALYWVNARRPDGSATDPAFLRDLNPRRVVALGTAARAWLHRAGLGEGDHATVEHPQHWKRFHHREPYPLVDLLREDAP